MWFILLLLIIFIVYYIFDWLVKPVSAGEEKKIELNKIQAHQQFLYEVEQADQRYILLRKQISETSKYRQWRQSVLELFKYKCVNCQSVVNLEVHHSQKSFYKILKDNEIVGLEKALLCVELWKVSNGEVLCHECHTNTDSHKYRDKREIYKGFIKYMINKKEQELK